MHKGSGVSLTPGPGLSPKTPAVRGWICPVWSRKGRTERERRCVTRADSTSSPRPAVVTECCWLLLPESGAAFSILRLHAQAPGQGSSGSRPFHDLPGPAGQPTHSRDLSRLSAIQYITAGGEWCTKRQQDARASEGDYVCLENFCNFWTSVSVISSVALQVVHHPVSPLRTRRAETAHAGRCGRLPLKPQITHRRAPSQSRGLLHTLALQLNNVGTRSWRGHRWSRTYWRTTESGN